MNTETDTVRILVDEELGIEAFSLLSKDFSDIQFATENLDKPDDTKVHPSYNVHFSQLVELVIEPIKTGASLLSIVSSILSIRKLKRSSGAPPTIRLIINGKEIDTAGKEAEIVVRLIKEESKDTPPVK